MKRLLLLVAAIIGLIVLGGALATGSVSTPSTRADQAASTITRRASPPASDRTHPAHAHCTGTACGSAVLAADPSQPPVQHPARPTATVKAVHFSLVAATAADRYLLVDSPTAAPGASVRVHGGGFAPGAVLQLTLRAPGKASTPVGDVTAGPDGTFQGTVTVPAAQTAPAAALRAQDASGHTAMATLLLQITRPLAGIAPNVVTPGQQTSLWVANFRPGEQVRVYAGRMDGRPLLTGVVGGDGHGNWSLAVPYGPGGTNQLVVVGDQGRAPALASYLLLNLYPHSSVSTYAPLSGTRITFFGGGFGPNELVELRLDRPNGPVLFSGHANAGGGVPRLGPYLVPFGLQGSHTFILRGASSHAQATVGMIVEPYIASARPSTYAAGPGTLITFYGNGFAPSELVRVYVGRTATSPGTEVAALHTTMRGRLVAGSGSFALPVVQHGSKLNFALVGDISGAVAWTSVQYLAPPGGITPTLPTVQYQAPPRQHVARAVSSVQVPLLVVTPPRTVTDGKVTVWGTGFRPFANVQLVLASPANPQGWSVGSAHAAADGTLNTTVIVPSWVEHADTLRAYSQQAMARTDLAVSPPTPQLTPSTYSGAVGSLYRLSGDGFAPNEQVGLYLDSLDTPPLATTTSGGGHVGFDDIHVPLAAAGTHLFLVKGAQGDVASVPFTLQGFTPFILLSTYSSQPERPVSVSGQGFAPGEPLHIFAGEGATTLLATVQADDTGAFHAMDAFTIPTSSRGPLVLTAVGTLSGRPAAATLDVTPFAASLWLSAYAGHPGSTVAFTGTGFAREDVLHVLLGNATTPATVFHAHNGAFSNAGAVFLPFSTPGGNLLLTVHGEMSDTSIALKYLVIPYKPGAGFEIRHHKGYTRLRLGAGGFAPGETVRYYLGTQAQGTPWRTLRADSTGQLPLLPILSVQGTPRVRLAYTVVGVESGTQATALYTPPPAKSAELDGRKTG